MNIVNREIQLPEGKALMLAFIACGFNKQEIASKCDPELAFCSPKIDTVIRRAQSIVAKAKPGDKEFKVWNALLDAHSKWEESAEARDDQFAMYESEAEDDASSAPSTKGGKKPGRPKGSKTKAKPSVKPKAKCVGGKCVVGRPPKGGYAAAAAACLAKAEKYAKMAEGGGETDPE